jgi:plasmid maintenance system antidote protein VapI
MIGFITIRSRLLLEVQRRLQRGEWTERALARAAGISQPHMHHLLKGDRSLTPEMADALLVALHLQIPDLLTAAERETDATPRRSPAAESLPRWRRAS